MRLSWEISMSLKKPYRQWEGSRTRQMRVHGTRHAMHQQRQVGVHRHAIKEGPPETIPNSSIFEDIKLTVLQVSENALTIKKLSSAESVKNLGLYASVNGDCSRHMQQLW